MRVNKPKLHGLFSSSHIRRKKQSPGLLSDPAQLLEDAVLSAQTLILTSKVLVGAKRRRFIRNRPHPFAQS